MAVTSIWPIKGSVGDVINYALNPEKTTGRDDGMIAALHAVDDVCDYAADAEKTEGMVYVTGLNCDPENSADVFKKTIRDMMNSKRADAKKRVCYHGYQSFAEGEVDADTAHTIGVLLAKRLWENKFPVLIATHLNSSHYHNHFIVCAVSDLDGSKFLNKKIDYRRMREESDRLCVEYGLSIIENPQGKGKNYGEWAAEKKGLPTLRSVIREAIDTAIKGSVTKKQFLEAMNEMGFVIDQSGKHAKIKQVGNERFVRFKSLGPGYSVDEIMDRIYNNDDVVYPDIPEQEPTQKMFDEETERTEKMDFVALNRCYVRVLNITKERPKTNRRMYFLVRQDHSAMRIYQDQLKLVTEHGLKDEASVKAYKAEAMSKIDDLTATRNALRNDLKRAERLPEPDRSRLAGKIRFNIGECTRTLTKLRREVTSCDEVLERIEHMRQNLMRIEQNKFKGKEKIKNEPISGRGRTDREGRNKRL